MEFYPTCQTQQLAPVIALSLGTGNHQPILKKYFDAQNIAGLVWDNSILKNRLLDNKYIVQYHQSEGDIAAAIAHYKTKVPGSNCRLSPFNVDSDIFPNGILSTKWFSKYVRELPFVAICVYQLGDSSGDQDLGDALLDAHTRYSEVGVRFVAVILSSGKEVGAYAERTAFLRQISGLARLSSLFYLNTDPEFLESDCDLLATTLFTNLRAPAVDFYSAIEHRVRQRYRKYYTFPAAHVDTRISLDPKFLEIRNSIKQAMLTQLIHPHNVESSLSILEASYEQLISLVRGHMAEFASDSVSDHDTELYKLLRSLLDIIAIHLIRGYISIEEPVAALRKHDAHIANVLDAVALSNVDQSMWVSIQYQWLAELMQQVPISVLAGLHKIAKSKNRNNQKSITYYGGISFHDKYVSRIVTEPSLLFLKAAKNLDVVQLSTSPLAYLQAFSDDTSVRKYKILILEAARMHLPQGLSNGKEGRLRSLQSLECLLECLIGDEYESLGEYANAIVHYRKSINGQKDSWDSLTGSVTSKILAALAQLDDKEDYLREVAKLCLLKGGNTRRLSLTEIQLPEPLYEVLVNNGRFLNIDLFVFEQNLRTETHAFDTILSQFVFDTNFDSSLLQRLFPNSQIQFLIDKLGVSFANQRVLTIAEGEFSDMDLQVLTVDDLNELVLRLGELRKRKILQIEDVVKDSGWYSIDAVKVQLKVVVKSPNVSISFLQSETHAFDSQQIVHSKNVYKEKDGKLTSTSVRVDSHGANKIMVLPYRPDISMKMSFPFATIIVGEKLDILFEISHRKVQAQRMNFSSVTLQARTKVLENEIEKDDLPVQTSWEHLKDDEPLSIVDNIASDQHSFTKSLRMSIRKPPSTLTMQSNMHIVLEIQMLVTESSGVVSVYELETYLLPIVIEPFGTHLAVNPKCNANGELEMPNPFILGVDSGNTSRDYSMPLPSRAWRANIAIDDTLKLIEAGDMEVVNAYINFKSKNAEIIVEPIENALTTNDLVSQLFVTKSKHRFTDRNVAVVAQAVFEWKRRGNDVVNIYETNEWELPLPLQDPRILLQMKEIDDGSMQLVYTIENPTPRILTFTTILATDEAALQGTNWEFDTSQNLLPLKQSAFPVLPFSHYQMVYRGSYELDEENQDIQLPHLHVYDVNYKVSLPTLPLDDKVISEKLALYIKGT